MAAAEDNALAALHRLAAGKDNGREHGRDRAKQWSIMKPCLVAAAEDDALRALHAQGAGRRLGRRLAGRRARRRPPRRRDAALQLLCSTIVQGQSLSKAYASITAQQDCDWTYGNDSIRKRCPGRQNQPACGNLTEQSRIRDPRTACYAGLRLSPPQFTPTSRM